MEKMKDNFRVVDNLEETFCYICISLISVPDATIPGICIFSRLSKQFGNI